MHFKSCVFFAIGIIIPFSHPAYSETPSCHPHTAGRCTDARSKRGFAWYRSDDLSVDCYAVDAPAGSSADDQRHCSPDGFAWYSSSDGNNYCYSVNAPEGTPAVSSRLCGESSAAEGTTISCSTSCLNDAPDGGCWQGLWIKTCSDQNGNVVRQCENSCLNWTATGECWQNEWSVSCTNY